MKIKFLGHSGFYIETESGKKILIDPFLEGNPIAVNKSSDFFPDYIILSHGHGDHVGSTVEIAKNSDATVICVFELGNILMEEGVKVHQMSVGGTFNFDFGRLKFTIAHHGSSYPDGRYAGQPAGILLFIDGKTVYHTGDTALFYDMKLIGEMYKVNLMIVPIGDNYTMGIDDAIKAVEFVNAETAIPCHFNTFPILEVSPFEFQKKIEAINKKCVILNPGEEIKL